MRTRPIFFAYIMGIASVLGMIFAGILAGLGTAIVHNYSLVVPAFLIGLILACIGLYLYAEYSPFREVL